MVRLSRAYSFASFVGIAIVAIALSWFYRNLAVEALVQYQTLSNVELTRTVANTLWPRYADFIANAGRIPVEHLATQPEIARLASELEQKLAEGLSPVSAVMLATRIFYNYFTVEILFGVKDHFGKETDAAVKEISRILRHGMLRDQHPGATNQ